MVEVEHRCPNCREVLKWDKGEYGIPYWQCSFCGKTMPVADGVSYPCALCQEHESEDGLVCNECKLSAVSL